MFGRFAGEEQGDAIKESSDPITKQADRRSLEIAKLAVYLASDDSGTLSDQTS